MISQRLDGFVKRVDSRGGRWLFIVAIVLLCASLAYQLQSFKKFTEAGMAPADPDLVVPTQRAPAPAISGDEIASWDLFGVHEGGLEVVEEEPEDTGPLPETTLGVVLRGTFVADQEEDSSAIIEGTNREVAYYRVGDEMPDGVELHSVYADHVVITRSGKREKLYFPEIEDLSGATQRAASSTRQIEQQKRRIMQKQLEQIRNKLKLQAQDQ